MIKRYLVAFFIMISFCGFAQKDERETRLSDQKERVYRAFLKDDRKKWLEEIQLLSTKRNPDCEEQKQLLHLFYGYVGWCIRDEQKANAREYLSRMEEALSSPGNCLTPKELKLYRASHLAFGILLSREKGIVDGPKCIRLVKEVMKEDPENYFAYILQGNIQLNMPGIFGGSRKKALRSFQKAEELMNKQNHITREWEYIHLLCVIALTYREGNQNDKAEEYVRLILREAPEMSWVRKTFRLPN